MTHKVTYVTCCTDLQRDNINHPLFRRHFSIYETGYRKNLDTQLPLISYNSVPDFYIPDHRNSDNFVNIPWTKEILMDKLIDKDLFNEKYDTPEVYRNGIINYLREYAPLVLMKYFLIQEAIKLNPFSSDFFVWADCQISAGIHSDFSLKENCEKFSDNLARRLSNNKFLIYRLGGPNISQLWRFDINQFAKIEDSMVLNKCIFGFFWGGHISVLNEMYEPYWELYIKFLNHNVIPSEELIFNIMTLNYKDKFDVTDIHDNMNYKQKIFENVSDTCL
jgi:hypothetical protein